MELCIKKRCLEKVPSPSTQERVPLKPRKDPAIGSNHNLMCPRGLENVMSQCKSRVTALPVTTEEKSSAKLQPNDLSCAELGVSITFLLLW